MTRLLSLRALRLPLFAALSVSAAPAALAQATIVNGAASAADIATELDGFGITISNANFPAANGSDTPDMYGLFSNGLAGAALEIDTGVALSTGTIAEMFTSNSSVSSTFGPLTTYTDPELTAIEVNAIFNVAEVTMDVTLDPYIEGFQIKYQFGSDEYPDFVGSQFNDLIAILISGPGIVGVENIADDPVGGNADINTINYGVRGCQQNGAPVTLTNNTFYIRNGHTTTMGGGGNLACNISQPGPFPVTMEWNGLTNLLTAEKRGLTAGGTYTLKIAVADVFDAEYDSGVIFDIISGVYGRDYGDAPNAGGYGNPYHEVKSTLRLGPSVTTEVNSLANATASGDADNGLTIPVLTELSATTIDVNATGGAGYLQAWFDWNDDGDFADAGEQVATNAQDTNGDGWIPLTVTPPATASAYSTFARFRWSTATGVTATANAIDGEIEDYPVDINPASTTFSCPAGMVPIAQNGDAVSVLGATSVSNPALALGAILASGAATTNANSASMSSSGAALSLDLGFTIPQNAPLILSVARDNNSGVIAIDTSPDGTTWTQQTTFNLGPNDLAQHVTINNPGGAVRYVRFRRTGGSVWIDGVQYSNICAGVSSMAGSKSISIYNPTGTTPYALPGSDVIYAITVTNTGANAADSDSVLVIDRVPSEVEVFTGTTPEFGGQVAGFTQTGTPTLTFNPATDLAWSASATRPANYAACNHTAATGYDPAITYVCFNPKGIFQSGDPDPNFTVSLRARIK